MVAALLIFAGGAGFLGYSLFTRETQEAELSSDRASLAIAAMRFRQLAAFDFPKTVKSYGASDVFSMIQDRTLAKKSPAAWSLFFSGALTLVQRANSDAPVFAYYNPLFDSAIITVWELKDNEPKILSISVRQGRDLAALETFSEGDANVARWLVSNKPMRESLVSEVASVESQFKIIYRDQEASEDPAERPTIKESQLATLETQLDLALGQLAAIYNPHDSQLGPLFRRTLAQLGTQDADNIAKVTPKNNPQSVRDILMIPAEARAHMVPSFSLLSDKKLRVIFVSVDVPSVYGVYEFYRGTKEGKSSANPTSLTFFSLDTQETK